MFTNAWFDERAAQLLELLMSLRQWNIPFELRQALGGSNVAPIELETLRDMIETQQEEHC